MPGIIFNKEVNVLEGDSLNLKLAQALNAADTLYLQSNIKVFNSFEQLGLQESSATMMDIYRTLPLNSIFVRDVYASVSGNNFPLPYVTAKSNPFRISGVFSALKTVDLEKCYFTHKSETHSFITSFRKGVSASVLPWRMVSNPGLINTGFNTANLWLNSISNIWHPGIYYFDSTQMSAFTDAPTTSGSFIDVMTSVPSASSDPTTGDRIYVVTENRNGSRWRRQGSNAWVPD